MLITASMIPLQIQAKNHCFENMKEITADIITGVGSTHDEAYTNLHFKLPSIGILQKIDVQKTKISSLNNFSESVSMKNTIKVNLDHILTQSCKINGQYAISAAIPFKGVNYLSKEIIKQYSSQWNLKEEFSFSTAKRLCGNQNYTIVFGDDHEIQQIGLNAIKHEEIKGAFKRSVVCGNFKLFDGKWVTSIFANKYNFIVIDYSYKIRSQIVKDYSYEMNLQMIHNAMYGD